MLLFGKPIRIGTRGSKLALKQADSVASLLQSKGIRSEKVIIKTSGDRFTSEPLYKVGGKGLFVKEIEEQLLKHNIDIAVHSLKDMSVFEDERFFFITLERDFPEDTLVYHNNQVLTMGGTIGTSSLRRQAELLRINRDLQFKPMRGNLDTRLKKLQKGEVDAIVVSKAGLMRLNLYDSGIMEDLNTVPAASQGVIAVECLSSRDDLTEFLKTMEHKETRLATDMERRFVRELNANCNYPIGAYAFLNNGIFHMKVMYGFPEDLFNTLHFEQSGTNPMSVCEECIRYVRKNI